MAQRNKAVVNSDNGAISDAEPPTNIADKARDDDGAPSATFSSEQRRNSKRKSKPRGKPFAKGRSGNPGGRPKEIKALQDLAREHTPAAISKLVKWVNQDENPAASVAAARELLDRAWGKSPQSLVGEGGEGPVVVKVLRLAGSK